MIRVIKDIALFSGLLLFLIVMTLAYYIAFYNIFKLFIKPIFY